MDKPTGTGTRFGDFLELWLARKVWRTEGGERWTREVAAQLARDLGGWPLEQFEGTAGADRLLEWRNQIRRGELGRPAVGAKRAEDYLTVLGQVLASALERGELERAPKLPDPRLYTGEVIRPVRYRWITEDQFRELRAEIYSSPQGIWYAGGVDAVARRRLYITFAFYTGMRKRDLDELVAAHVSPELGLYLRKSTKTGREPRWCRMPRPLLEDVRAELARLGRPWRAGERICGGRWKNVARVLGEARRRLGLADRVNLRVLRRSFARQKCLALVDERHLVDLLGHVDSKMVRQVYVETPRPIMDAAGEAWPEPDPPPGPRKPPKRSNGSNVIPMARGRRAAG